jgi:hypothetical protein
VEGFDNARRQRAAMQRLHPQQGIEADNMGVERVKVDHVRTSEWWNGVGQFPGRVAVRVNEQKAAACDQFGFGQVEKQGRFARATLAGDVNVVPRLGTGKPQREAVFCKSKNVLLSVHKSGSGCPPLRWPPRRAVNRLGKSGSRWGWPADERTIHFHCTVWRAVSVTL